MILVPQNALIQRVLTHTGCGGHVERKPFLTGWYVCPKCDTLLHGNNVKEEPYWPVVA